MSKRPSRRERRRRREAAQQSDAGQDKPIEATQQSDAGQDKPTEAAQQFDAAEEDAVVEGHQDLIYDETTGLPLDLVIAQAPRTYGSALTVAAIVHVNDNMIPGYDVRTVRSLGVTPFVGIRTDVSISANEFQVPAVVIKATLVNTIKNYNVFTVAIPINAEGVTIDSEAIVDAPAKESLCPATSTLYSSFDTRPITNVPDVPDVSTLVVTAPRSAVRVSFTHGFARKMQLLGGAYAHVADQFAALAASVERDAMTSVKLSRPVLADGESSWPELGDFLAPYNPFLPMLPARVLPRELSGKKIVLPGPDATSLRALPIPTTTRFYDADHHHIVLLAGVADELRYDNIRSTTGAETDVAIKFYPLPSPWNETSEEQFANYGQVLADGQPTEFIVVAQATKENKNLLGEVGDLVTITTRGLTAESHPQPNPTEEQNIMRMATALITRFQSADTHAQTVVHQRLQAALNRENADLADGDAPLTTLEDFDADNDIYNEAFHTVVRRNVTDFISDRMVAAFVTANPSTDAVPDLARCADALITELRRADAESDDDYLARIRTWIAAHPPVDGANRHGDQGVAFRGQRIPPPPGITMHHAMYHVSRARQPGYSTAYKAPYLKITFPNIQLPTNPRVYPYSGEMANLLGAEREPRPTLVAPTATRTPTERILTSHRNDLIRRQAEANSARNDPYSLSNMALDVTRATDPRMVLLARARALQLSDPHGFSLIEANAKAAATELLQEVVGTVAVVCATPVATRTLGNNTTWVPSLIFVDEAGRLTEGQFAAVVSHWPHTATIVAGDPHQFNPVVPSKHEVILSATNTPLWQDRFGAQREISILHRAQDNDAIDIYLTVNHRSSGNIIGWPSRKFYDGEMTVARANAQLVPAQLMIIEYLRQYSPEIRFCGLFVDIKQLTETKVATSFSSETTARFCIELAMSLWRTLPLPRKHDANSRFKILIISGYKVQVHELRALAEKLKSHAIPEGAIDIRTVDDSPSHEAEIVICDFPRSSSAGFLGNPNRLCVASTRAHYCTIYVGNSDTLEKDILLKSLIVLHKGANAFFSFPDRLLFCDRCHSYGHERRACAESLPEPLRCAACTRNNRAHDGRHCRNATIAASFDLSTPMPPLDNVTRRPLFGCVPGDPVDHEDRAQQGQLVGAHDRTDWMSNTADKTTKTAIGWV